MSQFTCITWIYILIPVIDIFARRKTNAFIERKILLHIAVVTFTDKFCKRKDVRKVYPLLFELRVPVKNWFIVTPRPELNFGCWERKLFHICGIRFSDEPPFVPLSTFRKFFRNKLCFLSLPLISAPFSPSAISLACAGKAYSGEILNFR